MNENLLRAFTLWQYKPWAKHKSVIQGQSDVFKIFAGYTQIGYQYDN